MNENFYAAPQAELEMPRHLSADLRSNKATRGARLGAALIDGVIVFALVIVAVVFAGVGRGLHRGMITALPGVIVFGIGALALIVANIVLLARFGQSLGKRALGIAIVRTDGSRCELWRILVLRILVVRLIGFIPMVGLLFSLVDMVMIFGEERRCVHDYMADTIVVHT